MKRRIGSAAVAMLWLGSAAATAAQAATPCLTEPEAEALLVTLLPDAIDATGKACTASLPPQATLRTGLAPLVARYRAEAPAAWPAAKGAIGKMMGDEMQGVDPEVMRPLVAAMIGPMLAREIKPGDCPKFERVVTLLSPLPARNTAGILVTLIAIGAEGKSSKSPFSICPATAAR